METLFKVDGPEGNTASLYVNGQKTNVWYFLPRYHLFEFNRLCHIKQRQRAETVKMLIDKRQITVDNWHQWDVCQYSRYQLKNLIILPEERKISSNNIFLNCCGYEHYNDHQCQQAIYKSYKEKWEYIQWSKRIIDNTLSNQPAIQFFFYGYQLGFVSA